MRSQNPRARSQRRSWGLRCEAYAPGEADFVRPPGPARKDPDALRNMRQPAYEADGDRKSTRLNSSHLGISYAVFCLKKKENTAQTTSAHPFTRRLARPLLLHTHT